MIYRYIYKITCTGGSFNNKFYFGQHTTNDLNDNYKGSGRLINDYYKKYPDAYIKEIILFCDTQEELNQAEYDIIKPWLNNTMCLNLRDGGNQGRFSDETKQKLSEASKGKTKSEIQKQKQSLAMKGKYVGDKNPRYGHYPFENMTSEQFEEYKINQSKKLKAVLSNPEIRKKISQSLKGKKRTPEQRQHYKEAQLKQHEAKSKRFSGEDNPNFGKCGELSYMFGRKWMNDSIHEYCVEPEYWGEFIDIGFVFGRKQK